jgi:hypothetical protein
MPAGGLVRACSLPEISEELAPDEEALGTEAPGTKTTGEASGTIRQIRTCLLRSSARCQTIESECAWYQESQDGVFYLLEDDRKGGGKGAEIKCKIILSEKLC